LLAVDAAEGTNMRTAAGTCRSDDVQDAVAVYVADSDTCPAQEAVRVSLDAKLFNTCVRVDQFHDWQLAGLGADRDHVEHSGNASIFESLDPALPSILDSIAITSRHNHNSRISQVNKAKLILSQEVGAQGLSGTMPNNKIANCTDA
jgi:hypothetical protein